VLGFTGAAGAAGAVCGRFEPVEGVEVGADGSKLPGPVYVPTGIEYPGPYAGVGKSSHASQWKTERWENEQPVPPVASTAVIATFRSRSIIEILSVPVPVTPAGRTGARYLPRQDRAQSRVIQVDAA
jgi:hypothetical protein